MSKSFPDQIVHGCKVVAPIKRGGVKTSRTVRMPDGTDVICRWRENPDGTRYWTAEVPIEIALEIFAED